DIEFLSEDEYKKTQTQNESELSAEEKRDIRLFEGQARALGLIDKGTSLFDDLNAIGTEATLAYYDDADKKMVIRGTELSVSLRVTVVHELTHALQDQAFGLDREIKSDGGDSFFHALVEGDATRIENEYVESLSQAEQDTYAAQEESDRDQALGALDDVAPALLSFFGAPYALGEQVTTIIVSEEGVGELNRLFRRPPNSDEGLMNVFAVLNNDPAKKVKRPALRAGERRTDSGDFGVVAWYLVLSSFVDAKTALGAVDGWGGDSYVGYRKDKKTCVRIAFVGDTVNDTNEMTNALNRWKTAFAGTSVTITPTPDRVELDTCEPDATPTPRPDSAQALSLPVSRVALLSAFLSGGVPIKIADCMSRNVLNQVPLNQLEPATDAEQQALFDLGQRIGRDCASGKLT
ncbi:MAG TPA: hypothetical protein VMZ22_02575, partial [Acidimicrobiales bacterium]|nr:hypothetical protein [Acidimicrobiales bacterium]